MLSIHSSVLLMDIWVVPTFDYCELCYNKHWSMYKCLFSIILPIFLIMGLLDHVILCLVFEWLTYWFLQQLQHFTSPPTVHKGSDFSTFSPMFDILVFFLWKNSHLNGYEEVSHCGFIFSLMISDVDLFLCWLAVYTSSLEKCLSHWLFFFLTDCILFLFLSFYSFLFI